MLQLLRVCIVLVVLCALTWSKPEKFSRKKDDTLDKLEELLLKELNQRDNQQDNQVQRRTGKDVDSDTYLMNFFRARQSSNIKNKKKNFKNSKKSASGCSNDDAGHFNNIGRALDGYDIMKGYPSSGSTELDPGIRNPVFHAEYTDDSYTSDCQFRIPNGILGYMSTTCNLDFDSNEVKNSQEHSEALSVGAEVSGGGWGVEFSASTNYATEQQTLDSGESIFIFSEAVCSYYHSRLNKQGPPKLNSVFVNSVKNLISKSSDTNEYYNFIQTYGTHVPEQVTFGARFIKKYEMTSTNYLAYTSEGVDVEVAASYSGAFEVGASGSVSTSQQATISKFLSRTTSSTITIGSTPPASGLATDWAETTKDSPTPIKYHLMKMSDVFQSVYFSGEAGVSSGDLATIRQEMDNALDGYCDWLKERGEVTTCTPSTGLAPSFGAGNRFVVEGWDELDIIDIHARTSSAITSNEERTYDVAVDWAENLVFYGFNRKIPDTWEQQFGIKRAQVISGASYDEIVHTGRAEHYDFEVKGVGLDTTDKKLYYKLFSGLYKVDYRGTNQVKIMEDDLFSNFAIDKERSRVYYVRKPWGEPGTVKRCDSSTGGSCSDLTSSNMKYVTDLLVDGSLLIWVGFDSVFGQPGATGLVRTYDLESGIATEVVRKVDSAFVGIAIRGDQWYLREGHDCEQCPLRVMSLSDPFPRQVSGVTVPRNGVSLE